MSDRFADSWNDEITTFANGAQSSKLSGRFDLIPSDALDEMATVLAMGADKYGENNWKGLPVRDNGSHALRHLVALNSYYEYNGYNVPGNDPSNKLPTEEEITHAAHAAVRAMFLLQQLITIKQSYQMEIVDDEF